MSETGFPCYRCGANPYSDCRHRPAIPRPKAGNNKPGEGQTKHGETGLGGLFSTPGAGLAFRTRTRKDKT